MQLHDACKRGGIVGTITRRSIGLASKINSLLSAVD
jgi:hypothetical protein